MALMRDENLTQRSAHFKKCQCLKSNANDEDNDLKIGLMSFEKCRISWPKAFNAAGGIS